MPACQFSLDLFCISPSATEVETHSSFLPSTTLVSSHNKASHSWLHSCLLFTVSSFNPCLNTILCSSSLIFQPKPAGFRLHISSSAFLPSPSQCFHTLMGNPVMGLVCKAPTGQQAEHGPALAGTGCSECRSHCWVCPNASVGWCFQRSTSRGSHVRAWLERVSMQDLSSGSCTPVLDHFCPGQFTHQHLPPGSTAAFAQLAPFLRSFPRSCDLPPKPWPRLSTHKP